MSDNDNFGHKQTPPEAFPYTLEEATLIHVCHTPGFLKTARSMGLEPDYFLDDVCQWAFAAACQFQDRYDQSPTPEELLEYSLSMPRCPGGHVKRLNAELLETLAKPGGSEAYVLDQLGQAVTTRHMEERTLEAVKLMQAGKIDKAREMFARAATPPGLANDAALDEEPYTWSDPKTIGLTPWLYGDKLLRGKASLLLAPGGVGKTFFTVASALALASGRKLLHDHVFDRPQRVRFWSLEEDRETLNRRLHAAALHYGLHGDDAVAANIFVTAGQRANMRIVKQGLGGAAEVATPTTDSLIASLKRQRIDVLIVDPFVKSHAVGENDNGAIDMVVSEWNRIAAEADCAVWLVHHTSKLRGDEANVESARGAKALADGVRAAHALNPMSEKVATDQGLESHFGYLRCDSAKANYGKRNREAEWYAFDEVDLGNGDRPIGVLTPFELAGPPDLDAADLDMQAFWNDVEQTGRRARDAQSKEQWIGRVLAEHLGADLTKPADKRAIKEQLSALVEAGHIQIVKVKQKNGRTRQECKRPGDNDNTGEEAVAA